MIDHKERRKKNTEERDPSFAFFFAKDFGRHSGWILYILLVFVH